MKKNGASKPISHSQDDINHLSLRVSLSVSILAEVSLFRTSPGVPLRFHSVCSCVHVS